MTAPDRTAQPVRPASSSCAPSGSGTSSPVSPRCAPCGGPTRGTDSCRPPAPDSRRSRRPRGPWTGCCPPPPSPAGPSRAPSTGPARPPDIAVGLHGNGPPSHRLLLVLRPLKPPPGPAQDRRPVLAPGGAQTLLRAYGIDADPGDLLLPRPRAASPAPGAVVLHPGAGSPARCRPVERYAAVAAGLRDRGLRVVVTGGPAEGDLVARLAKSAGLPDTDVSDGGLPRSNCCPLSWPTPRRDQRRYRHRPPRGRPRHTLDRPVRPGRTEPLGPAGPTRHRALR